MVTLDLEDVKVLTILSDQGPIGLGMASYIAFCGCHLVHFTFDVFHRLIRDLKLDVQGVGPKYLRQKLLHAQLCSSYLWTLNYRPYGSGGFAAAKEELVEHFLQSETQDQTILKILGSVSRLLRQLWSVKYMFVVHEQVTTAGISNYIKCIWEALVFSFFDCCQGSQLFNDYARLIGLDQNMAVQDHVDLDAVFHGLSELASFRRKQSPVKSGRWFSWNTACEEQVGEFFAMRMLLLHKYPGGNPDSNTKSFSQMRSDVGGFRLALQCCSWSVWLGVQVLRLVGKPCWDYYTQRVEGIKSPSQGLARQLRMSCSHLRGLVNVFWQKDEFDRIVKYHALSSTHLDDQTCSLALETFVLQIWYHTLSVLSKRSSALSKLSAPPATLGDLAPPGCTISLNSLNHFIIS